MGLTKGSVGAGVTGEFASIKGKDGERIVALAGLPNVGKSTLFNALTGLDQHTGNWSGKTVTSAQGKFRSRSHTYLLVDLPGTYSLLARSPEEEVARDFIASGEADLTVVVCDATCLCRGLGLVLQTLDITQNVIVCVNLMDEAEHRGISLALEELSHRLGVPVVGARARQRHGLDGLVEALDSFDDIGSPSTALNYSLDRDAVLNALTALFAGNEALLDDIMVSAVTDRADELCLGVVTEAQGSRTRRDRRLDRVLTGRISAFPVMLALLALVFWLTIVGANYPSAWLASLFSFIESKLTLLFNYLSAPDWLHGVLVLGVWRMLSSVVSVMLPPMAIFFPLFTLLEDSGYLPRIAYNLDRPFCRCGGCGKQALTMCMGFGCNAAGVVGCRIIDSPRERLLAVLTNSFVPCNGRFPTLIVLISAFFVGGGALGTAVSVGMLMSLVLLGVAASFAVTRLLSSTFLRGMPSAFALELPSYRRPQIGKVIVRSIFDRTLFVLGRAAAVAAPAGALVWILANITVGNASLLSHAAEFLDGAASFIGLDGVILLAFILGFPANETVLPIAVMIYSAEGSLSDGLTAGALGELLTANGWTTVTAICALIFTLFHWPCSTTLITVKRETGRWRDALLAAALPTALGILICAAIAGVARIF